MGNPGRHTSSMRIDLRLLVSLDEGCKLLGGKWRSHIIEHCIREAYPAYLREKLQEKYEAEGIADVVDIDGLVERVLNPDI